MLVRILIVDDNPDDLHAARLVLQRRGWEVLTAHSGAEALDLAHRHQPDVVLLDMSLPGMSGYEVCTCLRANRRFRTVPILAMVEPEEPCAQALAFQAGADAIITKPLSAQALTERLRAFLVPVSMGYN